MKQSVSQPMKIPTSLSTNQSTPHPLQEKLKLRSKQIIYNNLDLILVYTKKPGKSDSDNIPFVLKKGATIESLCEALHKDFVKKFNYAKVWGSSKYPGQKVSKDFKLKENDIVEIYLKK